MVAIMEKGDKSLYHRVKQYEIAKTEDQLKAEFSVPIDLFLDIEKHFKIRQEQATIDFENELTDMIDKQDQSWLGLEARLQIWKRVDSCLEIGPVMFFSKGEKAVSENQYLLHYNTLARIFVLTYEASSSRCRHLQQKLVQGRLAAFRADDQAAYETFVYQLDTLNIKIKEEVMSVVLYMLDLSYEVYQQSVNFYAQDRQAS